MNQETHNETHNSALQVANSILQRSFDEKNDKALISHLKLQKLLYILHGWHLAVYGTPAFREEVHAWAYGPVVPDVYHTFKENKDDLIKTLGGDKSVVATSQNLFYDLLTVVWEKYQDMTSFQLVNATHARGTPWDWARQEEKKIIDNEIIKDHYKWLLKQFQTNMKQEEIYA